MPVSTPTIRSFKPPFGPLQLANHPLNDVALSVLENEQNSNTLYESVSRRPVLRYTPGTSSCGTYWDVSSPWGPAIRHDNSGTGVAQSGSLELPNGRVTSQSFGLCMGFRLPASFGTTALISGTSGGCIEVRVNSSGTIELLSQQTHSFGASTATVTAQAWHTVGVTRDSNNVVHYYIDGVDAGGSTTDATSITWTTAFGISGSLANQNDSNNNWYSSFLHMWNRNLLPGDFATLNNEPFPMWQTRPVRRNGSVVVVAIRNRIYQVNQAVQRAAVY